MGTDDSIRPIGGALPEIRLCDGVGIDPGAGRLQSVEDRVRAARGEYWRAVCPTKEQETDFSRPTLAPYSEAQRRVMSWQFGPMGLFLVGPSGRGKTRSLWQLLRRLACDEGRKFRFYKDQELLARIGEAYSYGRDDGRAVVEGLTETNLLVVDDLGQGSVAPGQDARVRSWFFDLVDRRLSEGRPMIFSTNLTSEQLVGAEAERHAVRADPLMRRMLDACEVVKFEAAGRGGRR